MTWLSHKLRMCRHWRHRLHHPLSDEPSRRRCRAQLRICHETFVRIRAARALRSVLDAWDGGLIEQAEAAVLARRTYDRIEEATASIEGWQRQLAAMRAQHDTKNRRAA